MARRRNHRADENQPGIVKALRKVGVEVHIIDEPVDLLCGYQGSWTLLEVKQLEGNSCGRLTPAQQEFFNNLPKGPAFVVVDIEEAISAVMNGQLGLI